MGRLYGCQLWTNCVSLQDASGLATAWLYTNSIIYLITFNYSTNNTPSVHQLHNPTYDTQPLPPVTHSRAVSVLITNEGESLPITNNSQLDTLEQQPSISRLPSNSQYVGVDDENETNIYHILEGPGDDADYEDLDAELDAEEKAHTEDDQGENLYHVLEGPTLETEQLEDTTKDVDGE